MEKTYNINLKNLAVEDIDKVSDRALDSCRSKMTADTDSSSKYHKIMFPLVKRTRTYSVRDTARIEDDRARQEYEDKVLKECDETDRQIAIT